MIYKLFLGVKEVIEVINPVGLGVKAICPEYRL